MNTAFEALLQQISGLESTQREQEAKLAAEVAKHNATKAELQKGTSFQPFSLLASCFVLTWEASSNEAEDRWRQKVAELQTTFASVKAGLSGEERCNQQLKDEVRRLKLEANKIREALQQGSVALKEERCRSPSHSRL